MFSNLKQIFNTQSPHYKLAIVSTVAAAVMMSLLCMMALKANARMFSKFSKDLWVCAPQNLLESTFISPIESLSVLFVILQN